jgi:hypothetical protein
VAGPDAQKITADERLLLKTEFFRAALREDAFAEGKKAEVHLLEHSAGAVTRLVEWLKSGDYHPRFTDHSARNLDVELFLEDEISEEEVPWKPLKQDIDRRNMCGRWRVTESTLALFEEQLEIQALAQKFLLPGLVRLSYQKLRHFPLGPQALLPLAKFAAPGISTMYDDMECFIQECYEYHIPVLDTREEYQHLKPSEKEKKGKTLNPYDDVRDALLLEMTPTGQALYGNLIKARHADSRFRKSHLTMVNCQSGSRVALLKKDMAYSSIRRSIKRWEARYGETFPAENIAEYMAQETNPGGSHVLYEALAGDLIVDCTFDDPVKGFVRGKNLARDSTSYFLKEDLWFLETKSFKNCKCSVCYDLSGNHSNDIWCARCESSGQHCSVASLDLHRGHRRRRKGANGIWDRARIVDPYGQRFDPAGFDTGIWEKRGRWGNLFQGNEFFGIDAEEWVSGGAWGTLFEGADLD